MKNKDKISYSLRHRKEVIRLYRELLGSVPLRAYLHDVDKVLLLFLGLNKKFCSRVHKRFAPHHNKHILKKSVLIERAIDWESARFSKPDKQLSAREFMYQTYPCMEEKMIPIFDELGI